MTRDYEALVILRAGGTEQEVARHAAQLEEQIRKLGGRIDTSQAMGRRRLAFRISRQSEGYYHLLRFHAATERVVELERQLHLDESIVRFMILSADELPAGGQATSSRPAAQSAASAPSRS